MTPDRITLTVQLGDASFTADGPVDVVLLMYEDWLNLLGGCICEPEPQEPAVPAFREQPIGRA
jgi:hypothetical protein